MIPAGWLGVLGVAAGVAGLGLALAGHRLARAALRLHAAALLAALAAMLAAFVLGDLSSRYAWSHTALDYPLHYRLAGLWAGEEGTLLLWAGGVAAALLVVLARARSALDRRAAGFLAATSTALAAIVLAVGTFDATRAEQLAAAPMGRGLADVLLTPLMVVHPPIQFLAYALLSVPCAYALAHLAGREGEREWVRAAFPWARVAWLFATTGLGLGALWAYYVLSFGGYWAWDPVETANLLPWLALTAFLHAGKELDRHGDLPLLSLALAMGGFLLAVFATFATRSGLWVSVHAFTDPTERFEPDAPARLLAILDVHPPTRLVLSLLLGATLAAAALLALHRSRAAAGPQGAYLRAHAVVAFALAGAAALDPAAALSLAFAPGVAVAALVAAWLLGAPLVLAYLAEDRSRAWGVDARTLVALSAALLVVALAVAWVLNLQVVNGPDRARFDVRAPFVALPLVSALTVAMALGPLRKRAALGLAAAGALGGAAAWLAFPGARVLALSAPFLAAALAAVVLRIVHVQGRSASVRDRALGVALLLLALATMAVASNPPTHVRGDALPSGPLVAAAGLALGALLLLLAVARFRGRARPSRADAPRWRETGVYLVHLAVVLGLLGYAASTYSQSRETFVALAPGAEGDVGAYALTVGAPEVRSDASGLMSSASVPLALARGGGEERASLDFEWRGPPSSHYAPRLEVRRGLFEDVYVAPLALKTASGWVGSGNAGAPVRAEAVEAVTFTVAVLPLVGLVWAGLWMGVIGMGLVLAGAALAPRAVRQG